MKNKRNTYLLLASVAIIWGIIIYKMIHTIYPGKKVAETGVLFAGFQPKPIQNQDTFSISVHQRDPFLGTFIIAKTKNTPPKKRKSGPKKEMPKIPVSFSGMISGKTAKENIFFVSINNQQYIMKINDEIQQVKLVKGSAKNIRIRYHNTLKIIPVTQ